MEVMNYNNHNANEIAANILQGGEAFCSPERKGMNRVERIKDTVERWYALHPDTYKDPYQRAIMKHLYTALAYMGDGEACSLMEMLAFRDLRAAQKAGDEQAIARAEEEIGFWQTVTFLVISKEKEPRISLAYQLLLGLGCEKDAARAREIYERESFAKYETLTERERAKLRDARDGKLVCPMPEFRGRLIDAVMAGDRERYKQVFDEAVRQGAEREIDSAWFLPHYIGDVKYAEDTRP
ncbi:MAG: hypothetical protein E7624_04250 [Ruminococcaceae bacterium]|nr:hypothetical protein [Oscillospiraceae bacterium]